MSQVTIQYPPQLLGNPDRWLLLDTNIFINSIKKDHKEAYARLFADLSKAKIQVVTIPSVQLEFNRGVKTINDYRLRERLLSDINVTVLNRVEEEYFNSTEFVIAYQGLAPGVSYTDLLLGLTLKKYGERLALLTSNHNDFPTTIYNREALVEVHGATWVESLGIYMFSQSKYDEVMIRLVEADNKMLAKQV